MGKAYSMFVRRPLRNWNAANRAHKFIEKRELPKAAPRHPSTKAALDQFQKENPELLQAQKVKDDKLLANLQDLIVEPDKFGEIVSPERPLPQNRRPEEDFLYGYLEPSVIPEGRCSIKQALEFISAHDEAPKVFTPQRIAKDYKLDAVKVAEVLTHFNMLLMQVPLTQEQMAEKNKALGSGDDEQSRTPSTAGQFLDSAESAQDRETRTSEPRTDAAGSNKPSS